MPSSAEEGLPKILGNWLPRCFLGSEVIDVI